MSHTKKEKSNTSTQGWTIKGIEAETRLAVQKAAKKEGPNASLLGTSKIMLQTILSNT